MCIAAEAEFSVGAQVVSGNRIGDSRRASVELSFLTKPGLATQFAPQASQAEQSATEQRNCRATIRNNHVAGTIVNMDHRIMRITERRKSQSVRIESMIGGLS